MRWTELFADLEAQLDAQQDAEHRAEIAHRDRRELASIGLLDPLTAHLGRPIRLGVHGVGPVDGTLVEAAEQWLMVEGAAGRAALAPRAACLWFHGLGRAATVPGRHALARRVGLSGPLRALAGQRIPVRVRLVDGSQFSGTLDRVHADHVE